MPGVKVEAYQMLKDKLDGLIAKWVAASLVVKLALYTNNYDPVVGSVYSDFTAATFTGSTPQTLSLGSFAAAVMSGDVANTLSSQVLTFTNTGSAQTVYGYFAYNNSGNVLLFAESFSASQSIATNGSLSVQPNIKDRSASF